MDYLLTNTNLRPINETFDLILSDINNKKSLKRMRVLEIGIGNGNCSIPMSKYFRSYYGIEPLTNIYNVFIETCNKHNCKIKSYNMDLEEFVNKTTKKFDMIILRNVIHFIGYDELIRQIKKIIKEDSIIIIQNAQANPIGWGNKEFVKDSINFNEHKWNKFKNKLEECYKSLQNSRYLYRYEQDSKYNFFILKSNNKFII